MKTAKLQTRSDGRSIYVLILPWISARILVIDMELKDLSGNWKRLQETLKKSDSLSSLSIKRKLSNHASQDRIKRRKIDGLVRDRIQKPRRFSDKKGISEMTGDKATEVSSQKNSVASTQEVKPRNGKMNEGLSQTFVIAFHPFSIYLLANYIY